MFVIKRHSSEMQWVSQNILFKYSPLSPSNIFWWPLLDASSYLYIRLWPSVGLSVGPSVKGFFLEVSHNSLNWKIHGMSLVAEANASLCRRKCSGAIDVRNVTSGTSADVPKRRAEDGVGLKLMRKKRKKWNMKKKKEKERKKERK